MVNSEVTYVVEETNQHGQWDAIPANHVWGNMDNIIDATALVSYWRRAMAGTVYRLVRVERTVVA